MKRKYGEEKVNADDATYYLLYIVHVLACALLDIQFSLCLLGEDDWH